MGIKQTIKTVLENNPVAANRRNSKRRQLKNRDFTILTPNCLGGILLHDLGLRFLTPTVNVMMTQTDFLQFVLHLREYLSGQIHFIDIPGKTCPYAELRTDKLPSIIVCFTHYKTPQEAESKWRERSARINYDNLFVFIEERDGITKDDLKRLCDLQVRGIVAFTCNEYPDIPYTVYLPKYHAQGEIGNILRKNLLDDSREYERYFDFVKWFNEAEGGNYDVSGFIRK